MGATVLITILMLLFAYTKFVKGKNVPAGDDKKQGFLPNLLTNKYYVDELYNAIITKPLNALSGFTYKLLELKGVDFVVSGTGNAIVWVSSVVRRVQSGNTGFYIFAMVVSIIVILVINLLNK
jgi:NADH-quinone oxidoreductase subunit L